MMNVLMWPNCISRPGQFPEDTDITMTEYVKGVKVEGDHASLSTINCTPDGLEFGKDVEVVIKNTTSNAISFADVKHFVEEGNDWKEIGTADFDADRQRLCLLVGRFL